MHTSSADRARVGWLVCAAAAALTACFQPDAVGESGPDGTTGASATDDAGSTDPTTGAPTTSGAGSTTSGEPSTGEATLDTTGAGTTATTGATTEPEVQESFCGDGLVDPEINEVCDDGNMLNDDACTNFCEEAACGDGFVSADEACDDGDLVAGDGCSATCECERSSCGDGELDRGEECDDGNRSDRDMCSSCCERRYYHAFVSSKKFVGGDLGSFAAADAACTGLATAAGLPGTYQAWLAGDRNVAVPAAQVFAQPYALPGTAEVIAHSLQELRSGQLAAPIHVTETGEDIGAVPADACADPELRVWTGTDDSGVGVWNATCTQWTLLDQVGRFGAAGTAGPTWASCGLEAKCDIMARLYCFEVQT